MVLLLATVAVGGFLIYSQNTKPVPLSQKKPVITSQTPQSTSSTSSTPDETADWKTYTSKGSGYTIIYPPDFFIEVASSIYLKKGPETNLTSVIEIDTPETGIFIENGDKMSFEEFSIKLAQAMCEAGGPGGNIYCDKVLKKIPFTNSYGIPGFELYLNVVNDQYDRGKSTLPQKGPIFILDVSKQPNHLGRALFIIPDHGYPSVATVEVARKITENLRF